MTDGIFYDEHLQGSVSWCFKDFSAFWFWFSSVSPHSQWDSPTWNPSSSLLSHSKDPSSENPSIHAFMGSCGQRGEGTHFLMEAPTFIWETCEGRRCSDSCWWTRSEPATSVTESHHATRDQCNVFCSTVGEGERCVCVLCSNTDCSPEKDNNMEINMCPVCSDGLMQASVLLQRQS